MSAMTLTKSKKMANSGILKLCCISMSTLRFQYDLFDNMAASLTHQYWVCACVWVLIRQTHGTNGLDIIVDRERVSEWMNEWMWERKKNWKNHSLLTFDSFHCDYKGTVLTCIRAYGPICHACMRMTMCISLLIAHKRVEFGAIQKRASEISRERWKNDETRYTETHCCCSCCCLTFKNLAYLSIQSVCECVFK